MSILMIRNENGTISPQDIKVGNILLDASLNENHSYESEVPQYPTEEGYFITDSIINKPIEVTINGIVSTTPLQGDLSPDPQRADRAYQDMLQIRDRKEEITIVTPLAVYESMVMRSLTVPRSRSTGESFEFTAIFRQILKADVEVITIEKIKPTVVNAQVQLAEFINAGKALVNKYVDQKQDQAQLVTGLFTSLKKRF